MTERFGTQQLLRELYASRINGELDRLCALFATNAVLRIAGASDGKPISVAANGVGEIRTWLSMMVKVFKLTRFESLSTVIEENKAAVHWRVEIHSKITGVVVHTELVDLLEIRDAQIASYTEFFVPY